MIAQHLQHWKNVPPFFLCVKNYYRKKADNSGDIKNHTFVAIQSCIEWLENGFISHHTGTVEDAEVVGDHLVVGHPHRLSHHEEHWKRWGEAEKNLTFFLSLRRKCLLWLSEFRGTVGREGFTPCLWYNLQGLLFATNIQLHWNSLALVTSLFAHMSAQKGEDACIAPARIVAGQTLLLLVIVSCLQEFFSGNMWKIRGSLEKINVSDQGGSKQQF